MAPSSTFARAAVVALSALAFAPGLLAAPDRLESLLPDDVIGYVAVSGLASRVDAFLASDLRRELEKLPIVRFAKTQEKWQELERNLAEFRRVTDEDPWEMAGNVLGREVVLGLRLGLYGPEVLALARAKDAPALQDALSAVRKAIDWKAGQAVRGIISTHGTPPVEIETIDQLSLATLDEVLIVSNSQNAIRTAVDLARSDGKGSVRRSEAFAKATRKLPADALATLVIRPRFLPDFRVPPAADNALASVLLGGWLGALESSEWITAALGGRGDGVHLTVRSIPDPKAASPESSKKYEAFFPETAPDDLLDRLARRGVLGYLDVHRDLSRWWEHRETLLDWRGRSGLAQVEQVLAIAFGGKDLKTEILPALGSRMLLVARNQDYGGGEKPKPSIPGFALVLSLGKDGEMAGRMVTAFQTLVGFANMDRAQKGLEPGQLAREKAGDVELHVLSLPSGEGEAAMIARNFSPTMAAVGGHVVLASSTELGKILAEEVAKTKVGETKTTACDRIAVDGPSLLSILSENRELLAADNVRKKGISLEQASQELQLVLDALRFVNALRISSGRDGDEVTVEAEIEVR